MATTTKSTTPTTFYVDYATGSDTNSGTSPNSPWKHAPGDPNATGNVAKASLIGGDEVLFAGGVVYQGSINLNEFSGTPGNPIVYQGTGWGTGQAIMSGLTSAQLTFTPLPGNPSLSVATLPAGLIPAGMSTETESAMSNVVEIDGKVTQLSNDSTSTNPNFPDNGQIAYSASDMTGSGASWTFTDPALSQLLSNASPLDHHEHGVPGLFGRKHRNRSDGDGIQSHDEHTEFVWLFQPAVVGRRLHPVQRFRPW